MDDSKQAFPVPACTEPNGDYVGSFPGMTLREYYAGQALAGLMTSHNLDEIGPLVVKNCVDVADALIKELNTEGK